MKNTITKQHSEFSIMEPGMKSPFGVTLQALNLGKAVENTQNSRVYNTLRIEKFFVCLFRNWLQRHWHQGACNEFIFSY